MSAPADDKGRLLPFQTADTLARQYAEARLEELAAEVEELEVWLREARTHLQELTGDDRPQRAVASPPRRQLTLIR
jgi:hypothetical protein